MGVDISPEVNYALLETFVETSQICSDTMSKAMISYDNLAVMSYKKQASQVLQIILKKVQNRSKRNMTEYHKIIIL